VEDEVPLSVFIAAPLSSLRPSPARGRPLQPLPRPATAHISPSTRPDTAYPHSRPLPGASQGQGQIGHEAIPEPPYWYRVRMRRASAGFRSRGPFPDYPRLLRTARADPMPPAREIKARSSYSLSRFIIPISRIALGASSTFTLHLAFSRNYASAELPQANALDSY
jgi:hypothetical protein